MLRELLQEAFPGEDWTWGDKTDTEPPHFSHAEHGKVYLFSSGVVEWTERARTKFHCFMLDLNEVWNKLSGFGPNNTLCLVSDFGNVNSDTNVLPFPEWSWTRRWGDDSKFTSFSRCLEEILQSTHSDIRLHLSDNYCHKMEFSTTATFVKYTGGVKRACKGAKFQLEAKCSLANSEEMTAATHIEAELHGEDHHGDTDMPAVPDSFSLSAGKVYEKRLLDQAKLPESPSADDPGNWDRLSRPWADYTTVAGSDQGGR